MMPFVEPDSIPSTEDHRWLPLENLAEVEAWLDLNDRQLRQLIAAQSRGVQQQGCGICFGLLHGGEVYLHTNSEGEIILDVTEEASWCVPIISAVAQTAPPTGRVWILPSDLMIELILGLNSLIASSRLVISHAFSLRK